MPQNAQRMCFCYNALLPNVRCPFIGPPASTGPRNGEAGEEGGGGRRVPTTLTPPREHYKEDARMNNKGEVWDKESDDKDDDTTKTKPKR